MYKLASLFLITLVFGGCSKVYHIQFPENAKKLLEEKNGTVHLADNLRYETECIHVFGDSAAFRDKNTDAAKTVALYDIAHVDRCSRSLALSQGAALTLGTVGAEYVGLSAFSRGRKPGREGLDPYLLGGTLIGCVLGTWIHADQGSHESYIFDRESLAAHSGMIETPMRVDDTPGVKKVVKVGIELGNYLAGRNGSFSNILGFSAGFLTGINLYSDERSQYVLGIDLSYNKIIDYRTNVSRNYVDVPFYYRHISDERYQLSFYELGVLPEYLYALGDDVTLECYGGAGIGLGAEHQTVNYLSRTRIDSNYYYWSDYGPYGEYNMAPFRLPYSFSLGAGIYYKRLLIDVRFKYTNMNAEYSYVKEFHDMYLQLGFVL